MDKKQLNKIVKEKMNEMFKKYPDLKIKSFFFATLNKEDQFVLIDYKTSPYDLCKLSYCCLDLFINVIEGDKKKNNAKQ